MVFSPSAQYPQAQSGRSGSVRLPVASTSRGEGGAGFREGEGDFDDLPPVPTCDGGCAVACLARSAAASRGTRAAMLACMLAADGIDLDPAGQAAGAGGRKTGLGPRAAAIALRSP